MKILFITLLFNSYLALSVSATPDWVSSTNEEYLGSNDEIYAVMKTVTDNQGNYYSSRVVKSLYEYSKVSNAIINQELISDIIYNLDPEHLDPNTAPKITKIIKAKNNKLLLSVLTADYSKIVVEAPIPAWTVRLAWKDNGLHLDENLLILPKSEFTDKELPFNKIRKKPFIDSLAAIYQDEQCIYFSIKHGDSKNYENSIVRVSIELSKQINDWSTKLSDYIYISEHETKEKANSASLKLMHIANSKDYHAMNLEIWSVQIKPNKLTYYVVHRPFDLPINIAKIKLLNSIIEHKTKPIESKIFIQKWIPFVTSKLVPNQQPEDEEPEDEL